MAKLGEMKTDGIDVYPVGVLAAWQHRRMPGKIRYELRYLRERFAKREWRAIRMSFGGYHAEIDSPWLLKRCGHGWTKRRAVNDLMRHMADIICEKAD